MLEGVERYAKRNLLGVSALSMEVLYFLKGRQNGLETTKFSFANSVKDFDPFNIVVTRSVSITIESKGN